MNVLTLLIQDHHNVDALFSDFENSDAEDLNRKRQIVDHITEQLAVHSAVEEQIFYPALRTKLEESNPDVLESLEAHHVVKATLTELERMPATHERFDAKVTVLIELVRHHVEEEEGTLFGHARKAFTNQELEEMGDALEAAKTSAPTRPHPLVPDVPPFNVLLGVPVAMLDRVITTGREAVEKVLRRTA